MIKDFIYQIPLDDFGQLLFLAFTLSYIVMFMTEWLKKIIDTSKTKLYSVVCLILSLLFGYGWGITFAKDVLPIEKCVWLGVLIWAMASGLYKYMENKNGIISKWLNSWSAEKQEPIEEPAEPPVEKPIDIFNYQLSEHFNTKEFLCKCKKYCDGIHNPNFVITDEEIIKRLTDLCVNFLEPLRKIANEKYGLYKGKERKLIIKSGIRCKQHNLDEGGVPDSKHQYYMAVDYTITGMSWADTIKEAREVTKKAGRGGIGYINKPKKYRHVDSRDKITEF